MDGELVGLVTLEDIRAIPREQWDTTYVRQMMTLDKKLSTLPVLAEADEVLHQLRQLDVRQWITAVSLGWSVVETL